jgi:type II secretory pathway pseudopilin PulG
MKIIRPRRHARISGMSLVELLLVVGVLGVVGAVALPVYQSLIGESEEVIATDHVQALNKAVFQFTQNCWKPAQAADDAVTTDEFLVLRSLQYKFPASQMKPGSPYFDPRYNPATSSAASDFRIRWNGTTFELITPGQTGTGLRYGDGTEYTTAHTFASNYQPVGPPAL